MRDRLTQEELELMLEDTRWETEWRAEADRAGQYYDGRQLSPGLAALYQERGLAPLVRNFIGPIVDLVLGIEAKSRRDWKVVADDDAHVDLTDGLSAKLKQSERISDADRACSDAYAMMIKSGLGWVEVARESDPFKSAYRVCAVHRNEIYHDFRAKVMDISDARYLIRKQWVDLDVATQNFPEHAKVLEQAIGRWADWDLSRFDSSVDSYLLTGYESELRSSLTESEWLDTSRRRIRIYEVWYRHWVNRPVMTLPTGRVLEVNLKDPRHVEAIALGVVQVRKAAFPKVRCAWWAGPHFLHDVPSPYKHGHFPYVPFFGYREDNSRVPYGMIRRMMSPQDEVNTRLMRMMWLLSAKRVIADEDALTTSTLEMLEEIARPDAVVLLNPNRRNKGADAFRVETDFTLGQQQFQVMKDAQTAMQDAAGVYQSMLGKSEYAGQSGVAIGTLVEQGSTTLAELNDNYRYARRQTGVLLLSLVKEDIGQEPFKVVVAGNGTRREVFLNMPTEDPEGFTYLTNDVVNTMTHVELEDVPDTPTYRNQQFSMMVELAKSMPPELQPYFADFMVRASDLPFRHELADRIAKAMGFSQDPNAPPDAQQSAEAAARQQQAQFQQQQMELQLQEQAAKVQKAQADAQASATKVQAARMDAVMRAQKAQQEMVLAEDAHGAELDQMAFEQMQDAESARLDRMQQVAESQARQKQQGDMNQARLQKMKAGPPKPKKR